MPHVIADDWKRTSNAAALAAPVNAVWVPFGVGGAFRIDRVRVE